MPGSTPWRRSACVFALADRHGALRTAGLTRLHEAQIDWHRQWTEDCEAWRRTQGKSPIDPREYVWPVAPAVLGGRRRERVGSEVRYFLSRSQTMSTPSSSASTTLAGCFLSMWPTSPL